MSDCVVFYVLSVNFYQFAIFDGVWYQGLVVGSDQQGAGSGEVSVFVVEFVEAVSFNVHFASDGFVVSGGQVEVHGLFGVHFNGEECFVSEVEYSVAAFAFANFPQFSYGSIVGPVEVYVFEVVVSVGAFNPYFVGLFAGLVVSNVYIVFNGFFVNELPGVFQSNLYVYSVSNDVSIESGVRSYVSSSSSVQLSFSNQLFDFGGRTFDQVDGPVLVDFAGVVVIVFFNAGVAWFTSFVIGAILANDGNGYIIVISKVFYN